MVRFGRVTNEILQSSRDNCIPFQLFSLHVAMQSATRLLLLHKPKDPKAFLIEKLTELKAADRKVIQNLLKILFLRVCEVRKQSQSVLLL